MKNIFGLGYPTALSVVPLAFVMGFGLYVMAGVALTRLGRARAQKLRSHYLAHTVAFAATGAGMVAVGVATLRGFLEEHLYNVTGGFIGNGVWIDKPVLPVLVPIGTGIITVLAIVGLVNALLRGHMFQTSVALLVTTSGITIFLGAYLLRFHNGIWLLEGAWALVIASFLFFCCRVGIAYGDRRVRLDRAKREGAAIVDRTTVHV